MSDSVSLAGFIEAAGAGLSDAQQVIAGAELPTTSVAVAEAVLEAKVALQVGGDGTVNVLPLNRTDLADPNIRVGSISTVSVNFVALANEEVGVATSAPTIERDTAIGSVADRDDVQKLQAILGPLTFDAAFVPERSSWLVTAQDGAGRLVRESVVRG